MLILYREVSLIILTERRGQTQRPSQWADPPIADLPLLFLLLRPLNHRRRPIFSRRSERGTTDRGGKTENTPNFAVVLFPVVFLEHAKHAKC